MVAQLKHRQALLHDLPDDIKFIHRDLESKSVWGAEISKCRGCKFFDASCCAVGYYTDWTGEGYESDRGGEIFDCDRFKPIRLQRAA